MTIRRTAVLASFPLAAIGLWLWAEAVDERASRSGHGAPANGPFVPQAVEPIPQTHVRGNTPDALIDRTGRPTDTRTRTNTPLDGIVAPSRQRRDAVVVLGYRNRGARANAVNRFRVRAGIRSIDQDAADSILVLCGGAVGGETSEARLMERYARSELGFTGRIALDTTSRSTWENIANAIPLIEHATTIKIVSNAPHGELGRQILWQQRPDLAKRLVRGAEHRYGEAPVLKILSALRAVQSQLSGEWRTAAGPRE